MGRSLTLFCLVALFCFPSLVNAYSGGDGSSGFPYLISNAADLEELMGASGDWSGKAFLLTANIDASSIASPQLIGDDHIPFASSFDGDGYVISNVTLSYPTDYYVGFFGYVTGDIRNLKLQNVNVSGSAHVGGLCGYLGSPGSIDYCSTTGQVSGTEGMIGGLVGTNAGGNIGYSHSTCAVTCDSAIGGSVGGFCGYNYMNGAIRNSHATGRVVGLSASYAVGGFVGDNGRYDANSPGYITTCYATGSVEGHNESVGGFAGRNRPWSVITKSFASGNVTGLYLVGGFVGVAQVQDPSTQIPGVISNCFALGDVTATGTVSGTRGYAGGFVGRNQDGSEIRECFASGDAYSAYHTAGGFAGGNADTDGAPIIADCYSTGDAQAPQGITGGFVGWNNGEISRSYSTGAPSGSTVDVGGFVGGDASGAYSCNYWDIQTSGMATGVGAGNLAGVIGVTTAEMGLESTFTSCYDFGGDWTIAAGGPTLQSTRANDADGTPPEEEDAVPNLNGNGNGDGNGDGVRDKMQDAVTSLRNIDLTAYVTFDSRATSGALLTEVNPEYTNPDIPQNIHLPFGLFSFHVSAPANGGTVSITMFTPPENNINGFYLWSDVTNSWSLISSTATTAGGKSAFTFLLTDGGPYDSDGLANGDIVVARGGPSSIPNPIPALSAWGLACMALLLTGAALFVGRRQRRGRAIL